MKNLFVTIALALFTSPSFGAGIKSAALDASQKNIVLDVVYGGGCGEHKFTLQMGMCLERYPVACFAQLVHTTNDHCEALIHTKVVIPLVEYGLTEAYYSGGTLTIRGDLDWKTNKPSEATVQLPK